MRCGLLDVFRGKEEKLVRITRGLPRIEYRQ